MKESNRPLEARNFCHIGSNVAMMMAAVRSVLIFDGDESGGISWESDAIGGGFDTFSPHPVSDD